MGKREKWWVLEALDVDEKRGIEIDADVFHALATFRKASDSIEYLKNKYQGEELLFAMFRFGFFKGMEATINDVDMAISKIVTLFTIHENFGVEGLKKFLWRAYQETFGNEEEKGEERTPEVA